jgi:hypothetical protein
MTIPDWNEYRVIDHGSNESATTSNHVFHLLWGLGCLPDHALCSYQPMVLTVLAAFVSAVWFWAKKHPETWLPPLPAGQYQSGCDRLLLGSASFLAVISAAASLAAWDLLLFNSALEKTHLVNILAVYQTSSSGPGIVYRVWYSRRTAGHFLQVKIPFIGLVILIILLYLGLDRIWIFIKDRRG